MCGPKSFCILRTSTKILASVVYKTFLVILSCKLLTTYSFSMGYSKKKIPQFSTSIIISYPQQWKHTLNLNASDKNL